MPENEKEVLSRSTSPVTNAIAAVRRNIEQLRREREEREKQEVEEARRA